VLTGGFGIESDGFFEFDDGLVGIVSGEVSAAEANMRRGFVSQQEKSILEQTLRLSKLLLL